MSLHEIMQAAKAIAGTYFCLICLERSVADMSSPITFQISRSCPAHRRFVQRIAPACAAPCADRLACVHLSIVDDDIACDSHIENMHYC